MVRYKLLISAVDNDKITIIFKSWLNRYQVDPIRRLARNKLTTFYPYLDDKQPKRGILRYIINIIKKWLPEIAYIKRSKPKEY